MSKVSVIVMTYRRLTNLEKILRAWLAQTPDVWLCDSSNEFKMDLPIHHVRFSPDPGTKVWHAVALLTEGDFILLAGDDVLPLPGIIDDLINGWKQVKGGIVDIHGRIFLGPNYYKETKVIEGNRISSPRKVDFTGNMTLSPRQYLGFDLKGCSTPIEDLFWHMKVCPTVPKWVIPTKKYTTLPEAFEKECLFYNKEAREVRSKFYKEYYLKNYKRKK